MVNFSAINFKKVKLDQLSDDLMQGKITAPTANEFKEISSLVEKAILHSNYLVARNSLAVAVYFRKDETFNLIRRKGLFRYSKFYKSNSIIKNIAGELIKVLHHFGTAAPHYISYLDSVINFEPAHNQYRLIDSLMLANIKAFEKQYPDRSFLKTILSYCDFLFLSGYQYARSENLSRLDARSKEDIASAVSFLIHFYVERIKDHKININKISEAYINSETCQNLLVNALHFIDMKEIEVMIDHFSYTCEAGYKLVHIRPPFPRFEQAIRLGYIRTVLQQFNHDSGQGEGSSIEELVEHIYKAKEFEIFRYTESDDYPRYTLNLPEPIYDYLIEHFIKKDAFFRDEVQYLFTLFKEQLLYPDKLAAIIIRDDLSLADFFKIRRVFLLFYLLFAKKIYEAQQADATDILLRSLIPIFSKEKFYNIFTKLFPVEKIDTFLDIVCWEPGLGTVFDLQYHPVLYIDDQFVCPVSIFANSNSIRNLYASENKKNNPELQSDGSTDPLVTTLLQSLTLASVQCGKEVSIGDTDIDVLAILDDVLFIFECKHNLLPVSPFDLRTTFDYVQKAITQLDKITYHFNSGKLIPELEKKLGIDLKHVNTLQCSIILSNRLFNGNIFKYPVRNIGELDNMITKGILRTQNGAFSLWKDDKLTSEFLLDYLSLTNNLIETMFNSLTPVTNYFLLPGLRVEYDSAYLVAEDAHTNLKIITDQLKPYKKKE